jgi:beta-glucosidase
MPGPARWRGQILTHALMSNKVSHHTLNQRVREVLKLVNHASEIGVPEHAKEGSRNIPETAKLLRKLAGESIVLLKNDNKVLPFKDTETVSLPLPAQKHHMIQPVSQYQVAVIGPNAKVATFCGGGSAAMLPYYAVTPFEGISSIAKDIRYSLGCYSYKQLPLLGPHLRTPDGKVGVTFKAFTDPPTIADRQPVDEIQLVDTNMYLVDYYHPKLSDLYWAEVHGIFTPEEDGVYEFGLTVFGTGKLYLDDELLVDNETVQRSGGSFFNVGTVEEIGSRKLKAGQSYRLRVDFASGVMSKLSDADGVVSFGGGGIRIGGARAISPQEEIDKAVQLAKEVDQVVLCVGLNVRNSPLVPYLPLSSYPNTPQYTNSQQNDYEQEGHDREHMDLPAYTNDLVSAVLLANPNSAVVIQSGTPVRMPWADKATTILQAWYGGNETGNAIADVLFGAVNPSAKLPLSFPVRVEDNPAFLNYRSERGRVVYGEDVYVGYRFYEATKRDTLFPFGHGLSYTTFDLSKFSVSYTTETLKVSVTIENTGAVDGAEVVQMYVAQQAPSIKRPPKELKGFTKEHVKAGESKTIEITAPAKYATSFWDEARNSWIEEADTYFVYVGTSSADTPLKGSFVVGETRWWNGI